MSEEKSVIIGKNVTIGEDVIVNEEKESIKTKMCTICKEELPIEHFYKRGKNCKVCYNKKRKLSYLSLKVEQKLILKQKKRERYLKNQKYLCEKQHFYYQEHRQEALDYYWNNREKELQRRKQQYWNNLEFERCRIHNYYCAHKYQILKRKKEYCNNRFKTDAIFRLKKLVSGAVYCALKKQSKIKTNKTWSKLPYTPEILKNYLESLWEPWMSWENYGAIRSDGVRTWQIDHIIPQAVLFYDSLEHPNFSKCWALENLRPLDALQNLKKGSFCEENING